MLDLIRRIAVISGEIEDRDVVIHAFAPFYRLGPSRPSLCGASAFEQQQLNELIQAAFTLLYYYELRGLLREGEAVFRYTAERLPQDPTAVGQRIDQLTRDQEVDRRLAELMGATPATPEKPTQ